MSWTYKVIFDDGRACSCPSGVRIPNYLVFFQRKFFSIKVVQAVEYKDGMEITFRNDKPKSAIDAQLESLVRLYGQENE